MKENHNNPKSSENREEEPKRKKYPFLKLFFYLLFLLIIIIIIIHLLQGSKTVSGQFPANIRSESLVCETDKINYEKVNKVSSNSKSLKISMIFSGTDILNSATLEYILHYASTEEVHSAEAISHAQFNLSLQTLGYDASKFNNKFSEIDNDLVITLSLPIKKDLNETTMSYFLIDYTDDDKLPETITEYKQNYERKGFSCISSQDNK